MLERIRGVSLRRFLGACVLIGSILVSYTVTSTWQLHRASASSPVGVATDDAPKNPFASDDGPHLIAFVITASDCGWSARPSMMQILGSIRDRLIFAYGESYAKVSVIGVALDEDLDAGLEFLSDIGEGKPSSAFDQVMVGGSWLNEQVIRFVWREAIAEAASPQVIVIERPVDTESYMVTSRIEVMNDRILVSRSGNTEIIEWVDQGLPLVDSRLEETDGEGGT